MLKSQSKPIPNEYYKIQLSKQMQYYEKTFDSIIFKSNVITMIKIKKCNKFV